MAALVPQPEYAVGAEGEDVRAEYAAVRAPIVSISSDDEMMSRAIRVHP